MNRFPMLHVGVLFFWTLFSPPSGPAIPIFASDSGYSVHRLLVEEVPVIRLVDSDRGIEVSVLPSFGFLAYEMKIRGENILYLPETGSSDFLKTASRYGIPFMAPWANRLEGTDFWANGRKFSLDSDLSNFRKDENGLPIHGLIMNSALWQVEDAGADRDSAWVTGRLEFYKHPDLLAQWPFAHTYAMTYRLSNGSLEVRTTVSNLSADAMPLVIGFHPYFSIPDVPRDRWTLQLPARKKVVLDEKKLPTGEFIDLDIPNPLPLKDRTLDDGYTDMAYGEDGRARFTVAAGKKRIEIIFSPQYPVAQVWLPAPPPGMTWNFICIEPMTGITNGINLNHAGKYPDLQAVPAHGSWTGSFWIKAEEF